MGLNLGTMLAVIRRWWVLLLVIPLITGALAYAVGTMQTPMYASSSTLLVTISSSAPLDGYNANLLAKDLSTTYQALAKTDPVLQSAAAAANPATTSEDLRRKTSVTAGSGALFAITVVDPDPDRAAALVNAVTSSLTRFVDGVFQTGTGAHPATVKTVVAGAAPKHPYAPRLPAYLALGIIGGLLLASAGIFLRESLDSRVRAHTDLLAGTGLAPLAAIPAMRSLRAGPATLFLDDGQDPEVASASESIRALRNNVVAANDTKGTILVITSPDRGDGKTLVAANLAAAIAHTGKLVILVDVDLRSPQLHTIFQLDNSQGLGSVLAAPSLGWETAAVRVAPNLAVMPAGAPREHPADLLMSPAVGTLLDQLLTVAEVVILDTPSIDAARDMVASATRPTRVVLVCRPGKTRIPDLWNARECLEEAGGSVVGVVVNRGSRHRPRAWRRRLAPWSGVTRRARRSQPALARTESSLALPAPHEA